MSIYLPIAEMQINVFLLLFLGMLTGILSGMFGVGGGFLTTPLLIFLGIPPAVTVSSSANQIIAASFSGFLAHLRRANVDIKMGIIITIGGFIGSSLGVALFKFLKDVGQIDLVISLGYVIFLGLIGTLMGIESFKTIRSLKKGEETATNIKIKCLRKLPVYFPVYFPKSNIRVSIFLPILVGIFSGILVSVLGIGGGFVMIPAMIYIIGMPTSMVIGTSLLQIVFITINVTILQSITTHTVDIVLSMIMIVGSVFGAQIGTKIGSKISPEKLRAALAVLVLAVVIRLAISLFIEPHNLYSIIAYE